MNIEKLKELKELLELSKVLDQGASEGDYLGTPNIPKTITKPEDSPFKIGKNYLIRTVTMTLLGKLEYVGSQELKLSSASWIADTGRFHNAFKEGIDKIDNSEIEPFVNDVIVGRGSIIDATIYDHDINLKQK